MGRSHTAPRLTRTVGGRRVPGYRRTQAEVAAGCNKAGFAAKGSVAGEGSRRFAAQGSVAGARAVAGCGEARGLQEAEEAEAAVAALAGEETHAASLRARPIAAQSGILFILKSSQSHLSFSVIAGWISPLRADTALRWEHLAMAKNSPGW